MQDGITSIVGRLTQIIDKIDISGIPMLCIYMAVCALICFKGYKIYKIVLYAAGFIFGFRFAHDHLGAIVTDAERLLMIELGLGLVLALLAYKIYLAGLGMFIYQFARGSLKDIFDGPFAIILCIAVSVLIAFLATKINREVIVVITAVVGGFTFVRVLLGLIAMLPEEVMSLLHTDSPVWYIPKAAMSVAGVITQGIKEHKKK